MTILADLLSSVFERRLRRIPGGQGDSRPIEEVLDSLIGSHGEVRGMVLAQLVLDRFQAMDLEQKQAFFAHLAKDMDIDPDRVRSALADYEKEPTKASYRAYMTAAEPPRQELIRRLNQVPGGTEKLVKMRADLLPLARKNGALAALDLDFRHLFASWFNRGFLVLRPINWQSPAQVLEKIIAYEAVHQIDSWNDLRGRLRPADRRCFAFFHPSMPDEPLIFVEVALTSGIASSIQDVLADEREVLDAESADTAIFYSISNCQAGLAGVSFGNSLIKQVVEDLSRDLPNLKTFSTLSPIPGLAAWMKEQSIEPPGDDARLAAIAAHYLLNAKGPGGLPRDPVARFHLGNGAQVHAIHPRGDLSANGLSQSHGALVNYLYDLTEITRNHDLFASEHLVAASARTKTLAKTGITVVEQGS